MNPKISKRFQRKLSSEYEKKYSLKQRIDFYNRWQVLLVHAKIVEPHYFKKIRHIEACY